MAHRLELRSISKRFPASSPTTTSRFPWSRAHPCAARRERGGQVHPRQDHLRRAAGGRGHHALRRRPVRVGSPREARALGIGMVFQHFCLFEAMTVLENVALGMDDPPPRRELEARVREVMTAYGLGLDPHREVHTLSVGERQRIEIVRALLGKPKLLIMDEPTSVLTPQEVDALSRSCASWRARAARSSTSRTSSARSKRCARRRRSCAAAASSPPAIRARRPPSPWPS